jgi:hypothetical protein
MATESKPNAEHGERPENDDEEQGRPTELMALVVTDEFPVEVGLSRSASAVMLEH